MQCTSETVGEVADGTMLESTISDKKRKGDQTHYEYYCIHCPLETDEHGPTITHGNALREHQVRRHNLAPVSWIRKGRVTNCLDCGEQFLTKNNRGGSRNPHPKHATKEEKSRWINKDDLSKEDLANTFALESEYGYPSSRAKGKKIDFRGDPDKYRKWQEDQDERCGYSPKEWNAIKEVLKVWQHQMDRHGSQNGITKKTDNRAASGRNTRPARQRTRSIAEISEAEDLSRATSSQTTRTDHAISEMVTRSSVISDPILAAATSSAMPQYGVERSTSAIPPVGSIEAQTPASTAGAVEESNSWKFQDLECERGRDRDGRLKGEPSDELMAQVLLHQVCAGSKYFTANDVHKYQDVILRGRSAPFSSDGQDVLLGIQLVPHRGGDLALRSSDAVLREGRRQLDFALEMRMSKASMDANNAPPVRQCEALEREVGSRPEYSMNSANLQTPVSSSTTASSTPSASSSATLCQLGSTEMSRTSHSSMQPDLTNFTGHWMPPATDLPDYPLLHQQRAIPNGASNMESGQQKHSSTNFSTKAKTSLGSRISKDHQSARQSRRSRSIARNASQQELSSKSGASSRASGRGRVTPDERGLLSRQYRRHSTARVNSLPSSYTDVAQSHRRSFSGFTNGAATDSGALSGVLPPPAPQRDMFQVTNAFADNTGTQALRQTRRSTLMPPMPMNNSTTTLMDIDQAVPVYSCGSWTSLSTARDSEMCDAGPSTPSLHQEDSGLRESMTSSTSAKFSFSTPSGPSSEGKLKNETPVFRQNSDYQHQVRQILPTMQPDLQPRPAAPIPDAHVSRQQYSENPRTIGFQNESLADPRGLCSGRHLDRADAYREESPHRVPSSSQVPEPTSMEYRFDVSQQDYGLANASNYPQHTRGGPSVLEYQAFEARMYPRAFNMPMSSRQPSQYSAHTNAASQRTMEDNTVQPTADQANDRLYRIIADMCAKHFPGV